MRFITIVNLVAFSVILGWMCKMHLDKDRDGVIWLGLSGVISALLQNYMEISAMNTARLKNEAAAGHG